MGEESALPDSGFKFGSGPSSEVDVTLKTLELSPSRKAKAKEGDVFAQAEEDEAERQRTAFLAATYGEDGRRARERLTLGGIPPASSPNSTRRPSLMLWEKLGMAAHAKVIESENGPASAPNQSSSLKDVEEFGPRRGSLPIAIPGNGFGRSPSKRLRGGDGDRVPVLSLTDESAGEESESEEQAVPEIVSLDLLDQG